MIDPPFRSPHERVGWLYHFGRMLDKVRYYGVGTAYHTSCRLWFTLSHGIINEIYGSTLIWWRREKAGQSKTRLR